MKRFCCRMLMLFKYTCVAVIPLTWAFHAEAQVGYGQPIVDVNFGEGTSDPGGIGTPLPAGATDFTFSGDLCPSPNHYTIARRVNVDGCPANWIPLGHNHSLPDYGNFMLVNDSATRTPRTIFTGRYQAGLCVGTQYLFSAWIINLDKPFDCNPPPDFPRFIMTVSTPAGVILASDSSGKLSYASEFMGYHFSQFGPSFTVTSPINDFILTVKVFGSSFFRDCGDDFGIDDIQLMAMGPVATNRFINLPDPTIVEAVCAQNNQIVGFHSTVGAFYANTVLQWQQSTDEGRTWTDIPGATNQDYSKVFSVADTFLVRVRASEDYNAGDPNCGIVSNSLKVESDGPPKDYTLTSNSPVCSGSDLELNATGGASYIWTGPNGFTDNISYAHIFMSTLDDSGYYYAQIFSRGGCKTTDSVFVKMIGTDVVMGPTLSICKGETAQLSASGGEQYVWAPDNLNGSNPRVSPAATTTYTATVTDEYGCSNTGKQKVTVVNTEEVKAIVEGPDFVCRPSDTATFRDNSKGDLVHWDWDFNNGSTSLQQNPDQQKYFIAPNNQRYIVRLIVMDTVGCADTVYHVLQVADNCFIAVPTAFTPNNDGLNDFLYPLNAYKAKNLIFQVYNRGGQLVYQTRDWTKKWDGTVSGLPQPSGVYIWMLEYEENDRKISLKGTSALIR